MDEIDAGTHKGRRVLKRVEPEATIAALAARADDLRAEIDTILDQLVEVDRKECPGVPSGLLKNFRIARHFYGYCPCSWVKDQAEQANGAAHD